MRESRIIEGGVEQAISDAQEAALLADDIIFDGGEGCYRLAHGKAWADVDVVVERVTQERVAQVQAAKHGL